MSTQRTVTLPKHLWGALDDMARDGAQPNDALLELAVEQFVALQGYELPIAAPGAAEPAPKPKPPPSLQDDEDDVGLARTQARSALVPQAPLEEPAPEPAPEPEREAPGATEMGPAHKPGAPPPNITGLGPTHVPSKKTGGLPAVPAGATETGPAHVPEAPKPKKAPPAPAKPAPEPAWAKRPTLSDADEERAAARERMVAIDADVAKLTIERPTTTPLGQSADDE